MAYVILPNDIDAAHLEAVKAEMTVAGAPVIRCVRDDAQGVLIALEGSHRLTAAHSLGIAPVMEVLDPEAMLTCADLGYDDNGWFEGEPARAWDIAERISAPMGMCAGNPQIKFAEIVEA